MDENSWKMDGNGLKMVGERRLVGWEACRSSKCKHYERERWRMKSDNRTTTNVTCWCHLPQNHWSLQAEESWVQNQAALRSRNSFRCHGRLCSPCCFAMQLVPRGMICLKLSETNLSFFTWPWWRRRRWQLQRERWEPTTWSCELISFTKLSIVKYQSLRVFYHIKM